MRKTVKKCTFRQSLGRRVSYKEKGKDASAVLKQPVQLRVDLCRQIPDPGCTFTVKNGLNGGGVKKKSQKTTVNRSQLLPRAHFVPPKGGAFDASRRGLSNGTIISTRFEGRRLHFFQKLTIFFEKKIFGADKRSVMSQKWSDWYEKNTQRQLSARGGGRLDPRPPEITPNNYFRGYKVEKMRILRVLARSFIDFFIPTAPNPMWVTWAESPSKCGSPHTHLYTVKTYRAWCIWRPNASGV